MAPMPNGMPFRRLWPPNSVVQLPDGNEATSNEPYTVPITTPHVHQHLTETTQHLPAHAQVYPTTTPLSARKPIAHDSVHSPLNTIANYRPDLMALNNFISTSSEQPIDDISVHLNSTSLQLLLHKLQDANYLPKTLSVDNLDNSMRTLAKVLHDLKKSQKLSKQPLKPIKYQSDELHHVHRAKPSPGMHPPPLRLIIRKCCSMSVQLDWNRATVRYAGR